MNEFAVKLAGFKTKENSMEFLRWYSGGGEQVFYDHLLDVGLSPKDGCYTDVYHKGNDNCYNDDGNEVSARIKP